PMHAEPVRVGPGVLLAELALLTETMHQATALATEPSAVMRIPRKLFLRMLEGYPDAARRLRDAIAARANEAMNDVASVREGFEARGGGWRGLAEPMAGQAGDGQAAAPAAAPSGFDGCGDRHVIRRARPAARLLAHRDAGHAVGERGRDPDV